MMQHYLFNIGGPWSQQQWRWMIDSRQITVGFENEAGDDGDAIFQKLREGDIVVCYANSYGYVGTARVLGQETYRLVDEAEVPPYTGSNHRHWKGVEWLNYVDVLADAVPVQQGDGRFPRQTCEKISEDLANRIEQAIAERVSDRAQRFWWVNHKQTYKAEVEGGYIWSPKANSNGARNQTYDNLMLVRPGDVVVSYAGTQVRAIGVVVAHHMEQPKPEAFGAAGNNWDDVGWLVPVDWTLIPQPLSPKAHIENIRPLLPSKHSPLQQNGNGNQGCYLAQISRPLGDLILQLAGAVDVAVVQQVRDLEHLANADEQQRQIEADPSIPVTEKELLVRSRIGQGLFRTRVQQVEPRCRLTGVSDPSFLVASHIKPWRVCTNSERLDGNNGLMLAPHVDRLFDRGWISFTDAGQLLVADGAEDVVEAWGLTSRDIGQFSAHQCRFLEFHRSFVFQ